MAYCRLYEEFPARIKLSTAGKVHAAKLGKNNIPQQHGWREGDSVIIPAGLEIKNYTACGKSGIISKESKDVIDGIYSGTCAHNRYSRYKIYTTADTKEITCEACKKAIGISESDEIKLYVLIEKESGYYYSGSRWKKDVHGAQFFKRKVDAESRGSNPRLFDNNGIDVTDEIREKFKDPAIRFSEHMYARKNYQKVTLRYVFDDKKYEVRNVTMHVGDIACER